MITPQSERHVRELGTVAYILTAFNKPYVAGDFFAVCPPSAFVYRETKAIAESMALMAASGQEISLVSLVAAMRDAGTLRDMGVVFLAELMQQFDYAVLTEVGLMQTAAEIVSDKRKDEALPQLTGILRHMQTGGASADAVAEDLRNVASSLEGGNEHVVSLDRQLDEYETGLDSPERMARPVPTPWRTVNSILRGGILPGELAVLAARPSVGKSALALNMAYAVACSGNSGMVFSLEMSKQQLFDRLTANVGNIDLGRFREGLNAVERRKAKEAVAEMRGKSLVIFDDTGITVPEIRRRVRIAQRYHQQVSLVAVDYLQLVTPDDRKAPREQQVAQMSRALKLMAKDLCVPVLLLAQLNRKTEEGRRTPQLSDLRESGAIEQDADIVIFLHQARQAWHPDEPVQVIIAKGRNSGVGRSNLIFRRKFQRFEDSSQAEYEQALCAEKEEVNQWNTGQDLI